MKRITIFILVLGLVLAVVIGCGEDEKEPVSSTTMEAGELTDADLLAVQGLLEGTQAFNDSLWVFIDQFVDTVVEDSASLASSGKLPGTPVSADQVLVTYHEASQYWYRSITHVDTLRQGATIQDVITAELEDSIQFKEGNQIVQWPDTSALTAIATGALFSITTQSGEGNITAAQKVTVVGDIVSQGDVTLAGTRDFSLGWTGPGGECSASMVIGAVATDVDMNITTVNGGGCPASGSLRHEGTIALGCTGDTAWSYSDNWVISQVFHGDSTVVHIENSTTYWDYVDYCDGTGPVAKTFEEVIADLKPRD